MDSMLVGLASEAKGRAPGDRDAETHERNDFGKVISRIDPWHVVEAMIDPITSPWLCFACLSPALFHIAASSFGVMSGGSLRFTSSANRPIFSLCLPAVFATCLDSDSINMPRASCNEESATRNASERVSIGTSGVLLGHTLPIPSEMDPEADCLFPAEWCQEAQSRGQRAHRCFRMDPTSTEHVFRLDTDPDDQRIFYCSSNKPSVLLRKYADQGATWWDFGHSAFSSVMRDVNLTFDSGPIMAQVPIAGLPYTVCVFTNGPNGGNLRQPVDLPRGMRQALEHMTTGRAVGTLDLRTYTAYGDPQTPSVTENDRVQRSDRLISPTQVIRISPANERLYITLA